MIEAGKEKEKEREVCFRTGPSLHGEREQIPGFRVDQGSDSERWSVEHGAGPHVNELQDDGVLLVLVLICGRI